VDSGLKDLDSQSDTNRERERERVGYLMDELCLDGSLQEDSSIVVQGVFD